MLLARVVRARPDVVDHGVSVVACDPGQVFGTGLARDLPAPMRLAWRVMGSPVGRPLRRFNRHQNTLSEAGHALATLAQPALSPSAEGGYASLRRGRLAWTGAVGAGAPRRSGAAAVAGLGRTRGEVELSPLRGTGRS